MKTCAASGRALFGFATFVSPVACLNDTEDRQIRLME
jgi:hypothetical protein